MAHEFESGFSVKKVMWHKLGKVIDEAPSTKEGIKLAGLDWKVELKDLVTVEQAQNLIQQSPSEEDFSIESNIDHRAVVRSTDKEVLGVVGKHYHVLQNKDAFSWFDDYIDAGLCTLETAGSLKNGKVVWILATIQRPNEKIVENDEIKKYFLLSNSHDGTQAVRVGASPIRVVCANTLSFAHNSRKSSLIRIRHGRNVKKNLDYMKKIIDEIDMSFKATTEQFQFLLSKQISSTDLRNYVKILLNVDQIEDIDLKTRTKNTIDKIIGKMDSPSQQIKGVSGTWYAAYHAYNEWLCHESGRNNDNRLYNIWFGQGVLKNNKALDMAIKMAN